jgi:hypothetical protein
METCQEKCRKENGHQGSRRDHVWFAICKSSRAGFWARPRMCASPRRNWNPPRSKSCQRQVSMAQLREERTRQEPEPPKNPTAVRVPGVGSPDDLLKTARGPRGPSRLGTPAAVGKQGRCWHDRNGGKPPEIDRATPVGLRQSTETWDSRFPAHARRLYARLVRQ